MTDGWVGPARVTAPRELELGVVLSHAWQVLDELPGYDPVRADRARRELVHRLRSAAALRMPRVLHAEDHTQVETIRCYAGAGCRRMVAYLGPQDFAVFELLRDAGWTAKQVGPTGDGTGSREWRCWEHRDA